MTRYYFLIYLPLLLVFGTVNSFAQTTLSGKVENKEGLPIAFANIVLTDSLNDQLLLGTVSDENGSFELEIEKKGDYLLTILYIGYKDWKKSLPIEQSLDLGSILLEEDINQLEDVVVTASRPVMERIEDKLVFNIASSPLKEGYDGIEVLQQTPYVWVDSEGGILMRNAAPRVRINGRPLNLQGEELTTYLRNIPSDNIKSIEVQTTPGASANADNLGGVINIVLRKKMIGFNSSQRISLEYMGEQYYQGYARANLNYGANLWNVYASYNHLNRNVNATIRSSISYLASDDFLETERADNRVEDRHNYQLGFVLAPWKNHEFGAEFFGRARTRYNVNDSDLQLSNGEDILETGNTLSTNDIADHVNNLVFNYTWTLDTLNSTLKVIADGIQQEYEDEFSAATFYRLMRFTDNFEKSLFNNETNIYSLQSDLNKKFQGDWVLGFGARYGKTERNNDLLAERLFGELWQETDQSASLSYEEGISAVYTNVSKSFLEKHFVKIGLRVEHTDLKSINWITNQTIPRNYNNWFPAFYYAYDLSAESSISARYSKRFNRPDFSELNNNVIKVNDFRYFIGNPNLQPEDLHIYELSFQRKKHTAALYFRQSNNAINGVYDLIDSIAYYQRKNEGSQKQIGLEYNLSADIQSWWSLRSAINVYHRKFTNEEGADSFQQSTLSLRLFNNFKLNKTSGIDLTFRYLSPVKDAFYVQDQFYYFDLLFKKSFLDKRLNCRIYVYDVLNSIVWGNTRPFPDIITTNVRKPRTRSIEFWMSYNFSNQNKTNNRKNRSENEARNRL